MFLRFCHCDLILNPFGYRLSDCHHFLAVSRVPFFSETNPCLSKCQSLWIFSSYEPIQFGVECYCLRYFSQYLSDKKHLLFTLTPRHRSAHFHSTVLYFQITLLKVAQAGTNIETLHFFKNNTYLRNGANTLTKKLWKNYIVTTFTPNRINSLLLLCASCSVLNVSASLLLRVKLKSLPACKYIPFLFCSAYFIG